MSDDVGKLAVARYNRELAARESHAAEVDAAVNDVIIATKDMIVYADWTSSKGTRLYTDAQGRHVAALTNLSELAKQGPRT